MRALDSFVGVCGVARLATTRALFCIGVLAAAGCGGRSEEVIDAGPASGGADAVGGAGGVAASSGASGIGGGSSMGTVVSGGRVSPLLDGIYQLTYATLNPLSCAVEGPSVLDQQAQRFFFVKDSSFDGPSGVLFVDTCVDTVDCRAKAVSENATGIVANSEWSFALTAFGTFDSGATTYRGAEPNSTSCTGDEIQNASVTGVSGVSARVDVHILGFPPRAPDAGCSASLLLPTTCLELAVYAGQYQEAL